MVLTAVGANKADFSHPDRGGRPIVRDDFSGRHVLLLRHPMAGSPG